jgi:hypothetical protein
VPLLLVIGCCSAASAAIACPTEPRTEAGVLATEKAWVAALESRDARALDCILSPDFADTSWRGELIPKARVMEALPGRPASTLTLTDLHATLIGDVAMMRGVNTQRAGEKVLGSVRFVDLFVYRSGRWQAISAQESLIQSK